MALSSMRLEVILNVTRRGQQAVWPSDKARIILKPHIPNWPSLTIKAGGIRRISQIEMITKSMEGQGVINLDENCAGRVLNTQIGQVAEGDTAYGLTGLALIMPDEKLLIIFLL